MKTEQDEDVEAKPFIKFKKDICADSMFLGSSECLSYNSSDQQADSRRKQSVKSEYLLPGGTENELEEGEGSYD